MPKYYKTKTD